MRLRWSGHSQADRGAIFNYHVRETGSLETSLRFDAAFDDQSAFLADFPHAGRIGRADNTRELVVRDTPYILAYRVHEDVVLMLRVIHHAQRWPRRL